MFNFTLSDPNLYSSSLFLCVSLTNRIQSNPIESNRIQSSPIEFNRIQSNPIESRLPPPPPPPCSARPRALRADLSSFLPFLGMLAFGESFQKRNRDKSTCDSGGEHSERKIRLRRIFSLRIVYLSSCQSILLKRFQRLNFTIFVNFIERLKRFQRLNFIIF